MPRGRGFALRGLFCLPLSNYLPVTVGIFSFRDQFSGNVFMHFHTPPDYSNCSFVCFNFSGVGMDCSIESSDEHFKGDEFLEQLRHTAQVSCMVGGFFDRQLNPHFPSKALISLS